MDADDDDCDVESGNPVNDVDKIGPVTVTESALDVSLSVTGNSGVEVMAAVELSELPPVMTEPVMGMGVVMSVEVGPGAGAVDDEDDGVPEGAADPPWMTNSGLLFPESPNTAGTPRHEHAVGISTEWEGVLTNNDIVISSGHQGDCNVHLSVSELEVLCQWVVYSRNITVSTRAPSMDATRSDIYSSNIQSSTTSPCATCS